MEQEFGRYRAELGDGRVVLFAVDGQHRIRVRLDEGSTDGNLKARLMAGAFDESVMAAWDELAVALGQPSPFGLKAASNPRWEPPLPDQRP